MRSGSVISRNCRKLLDFASNDYLGLSNHPKIKQASKQAIEKYGTSASASRLLSGDLQMHHELEEKTAKLKAAESALVFNSGYQANVGIISALCKTGDAIFSDRLSHASILDGIAMSKAKLFRFRHNDTNHLESLLTKHSNKFKNRLIVTETVFSMDGDIAPLKDIVDLKEKFACTLMVDEAHATGIFGKNGAGIASEQGLTDRVDLIMGTFSKALGSFGGYVAGAKKLVQYLINTSRSFIYSTALPPAVIAANIAALELLKAEAFRRESLLENAKFFRNRLAEKGIKTTSSSQIVPLIVKDTEKTIALSNHLLDKGFLAPAIRPPTVPPGQARLRLSLTYDHDRKTLNKLLEHICEAFDV
jgi:8-amino-7-oxononanoate synthase